MANNKAFVVFCVDGPTDIDVLKRPIEELYDDIGGDDINVDFRYALLKEKEGHEKKCGDITSLSSVEPENIHRMIYKYYFKQQDRSSNLGWDDVTHIVHIIDLDGAYVKETNIHEYDESERSLAIERSTNNEMKDTLYFDSFIAVNPDKFYKMSPIQRMVERNQRKRRNIEYLLSEDCLSVGKRRVSYELYYFSSNIDHYLHGDANLSGIQKTREAMAFSSLHTDGEALYKYFCNSCYSAKDDYDSSWRMIKKSNGSLLRGSNVNILLDKIVNSSIEDWL